MKLYDVKIDCMKSSSVKLNTYVHISMLACRSIILLIKAQVGFV